MTAAEALAAQPDVRLQVSPHLAAVGDVESAYSRQGQRVLALASGKTSDVL